MTVLRVVSASILALGLSLVILSAVILSSVNRNTRLVEEMKKESVLQHINTQELHLIIIRYSVGFMVLGLFSVVSGIGLLFRRNWARIFWLGIVAVVLIWNAYDLVSALWYGRTSAEDVVPSIVVLILIGASGIYFSNKNTKGFFIDREHAG